MSVSIEKNFAFNVLLKIKTLSNVLSTIAELCGDNTEKCLLIGRNLKKLKVVTCKGMPHAERAVRMSFQHEDCLSFKHDKLCTRTRLHRLPRKKL